MRIGIDARFYGEAGPGRYIKNVLENLEKLDDSNDYVVFLRRRGMEAYHPQNLRFKKVVADYKWYSFGEQLGFVWVLLRANLDLLYVPHFNIPVLYPKQIVAAIPDLIMHQFSTEEASTLPRPFFALKKFVYKLVVFWAVLRAKKIIIPSHDVKNEFLRTSRAFKAKKDEFVVAYEGVDKDLTGATFSDVEATEVLREFGISKPFLLYVSSFYPHKNVGKLLEAFKILQSKFGFGGKLVLVGKKDVFSTRVAELVESKGKGLGATVIMPGQGRYVSDRELVALKKSAKLYVFPSLKEGFSLTPLEAMAVGLPTVISDIPCHREIYGDASYYFDPNEAEDIASKINDVLKDEQLQQSLKSKGHELLNKYSWTETAKITLDIFNQLGR